MVICQRAGPIKEATAHAIDQSLLCSPQYGVIIISAGVGDVGKGGDRGSGLWPSHGSPKEGNGLLPGDSTGR